LDPYYLRSRYRLVGLKVILFAVVIVLPRKSWLKKPEWAKPDEHRTLYGVLCTNNHFAEDEKAEWRVTETNRNGNRGRQFIRATTDNFTHYPLDYDDEFFLCFTDEIIHEMVVDGYYDPRDADVLEFQRNYYAADEANGANQMVPNDVASEISSKFQVEREFSSISKVVEWRDRNPKKQNDFVAGISGNIAEIQQATQIAQNDLSLLSDFPAASSVADSSDSSAESQIEICPERSSTPNINPEKINESTQTTVISEKTDSSSYCNCGASLEIQKSQKMSQASSSENSSISLDDLQSQVRKLENWQKKRKAKRRLLFERVELAQEQFRSSCRADIRACLLHRPRSKTDDRRHF